MSVASSQTMYAEPFASVAISGLNSFFCAFDKLVGVENVIPSVDRLKENIAATGPSDVGPTAGIDAYRRAVGPILSERHWLSETCSAVRASGKQRNRIRWRVRVKNNVYGSAWLHGYPRVTHP